MNQTKKRNAYYSQEFKDEVALRILTGESKIYELMKEYGISRDSIKHWEQQYIECHPDEDFSGRQLKKPADCTGQSREKVILPRLKELRMALGYSQSDIGKVLGIQQDAYAKYETGMVELPVRRLLVLSRFYHVTTDYLINLSDDNTLPDAE